MSGILCHRFIIACHANAFLKSGTTSRFFPSNRVFKFCDRVEFVDGRNLRGNTQAVVIADDPNEWYYLTVCYLVVITSA